MSISTHLQLQKLGDYRIDGLDGSIGMLTEAKKKNAYASYHHMMFVRNSGLPHGDLRSL